MKRMHLHISVADLQQSIRFYSGMFAAAPTVVKDDYAKWMLDDPRINFAISKRGRAIGLDHLGIQTESSGELQEIEQRLKAAELPHLSQPGSSCCYAQSDKHWSMDPNGIAWEAFHTLDIIPTFGKDTLDMQKAGATSSGCVVSAVKAKIAEKAACCTPIKQENADKAKCC